MTPTVLALIGLAPTIISGAGWIWSNWLHHKTSNVALQQVSDTAVAAVQAGAQAAATALASAGTVNKQSASAAGQAAAAAAVGTLAAKLPQVTVGQAPAPSK